MERTSVDRDELAAALHRVCADPVFVRAPQLRRLLEYLVQCAIDGDRHLKEYTIAVEALGRAADFDPDRDASVRVQASRLRRALERYYADGGSDDPVQIVLPAGSYVVACRRRDPVPSGAKPRRAWRPVAFAAGGVVALMIAAVLVVVFRGQIDSATTSTPIGQETNAAPMSTGLPIIVVLPFEGPGAEIDIPALIGLERRIVSAFSQFETVAVVHARQPPPAGGRLSAGEPIYSLSTMVTLQKSDLRILFQLSDRAAGTIVWTQAFEVPIRSDGDALQETIVRRLAATLLQPFGIITSRDRAHHLRTGLGDPRYRCMLQTMDALREGDRAGYHDARGCLEKVIASDPANALAHSYLALVLNRLFQYGGETADVLDRALVAARHAVRANPVSARAYFALFVTRYNMREFDAAETAMEKADALNTYDLVMRSEHGGRLVARGRIDEGMAILDAVDDGFQARSCAHGFYTFLGHYMRDNAAEARRRAYELACPSYPYAFLAKALAAIDAGEPQTASAALDAVAARLPGWRADPHGALGRTIPDTAIVDRIMHDLAAAEPVTAIRE